MALWKINAKPWPIETLGEIVPSEVLAAYDGPLTFTFLDAVGNQMFAHLCAAEGDLIRYLVAPTNDRIIHRLKHGFISIRSAIDQPLLWVVDVESGGVVARCWAQKLKDLPPGAVPDSDVMLYPELDPLIRLYETGFGLQSGSMPTGTLRTAVSGVENAVRSLTNFSRQQLHLGRPSEEDRQFYRLEVQELAAASLSISFRHATVDPSLLEDQERAKVLAHVEDMLSRGLRWSQTGEVLSKDTAEWEAILGAIREISPGRGAAADVVEVSGRVVEGIDRKIRLTRFTRELASESIRGLRQNRAQPEFVATAGRVREADKDKFSFTLRDRANNEPELSFAFSEEHQDGVMDAFQGDYQVYVIGRPNGGVYDLLEIVDINLPGTTAATE